MRHRMKCNKENKIDNIKDICNGVDKMLSYRRETALQGTLVLAESGRLQLGDNILLIL